MALWKHTSFLCEFLDCFIGGIGGQLTHLLKVFCLGLEGAQEALAESQKSLPWNEDDNATLARLLTAFQKSEPLFRKWQPLWSARSEEAHTIPPLAASYIKRLQVARQALQTDGGTPPIPLGVKTSDDDGQSNNQFALIILEKTTPGAYRVIVVNSGMPGLDHHARSSAQPPKLKYQACMSFDGTPALPAEDGGIFGPCSYSSRPHPTITSTGSSPR